MLGILYALNKSNKLLVLFSLASLLLAIFTLIIRNQFVPDRAIINLAVISLALLILWTKSWQLNKKLVGIIILLGLIGLFISLLFKDDYPGGEWLFHFHRGYPYSWMDSGMSIWPAVDKGITVSEYIAQNPKAIQWSVDFRALIVDSLFWINSSIVITRMCEALMKIIRTHLRQYNEDATSQ